MPFTVTTGKDTNVDGNTNDCGNLVGNPLLEPHHFQSEVVAEWFNKGAFAVPTAGTDGKENLAAGARGSDQRVRYGQPHDPQLRAGGHCERQSRGDEIGAVWADPECGRHAAGAGLGLRLTF